MLHVADDPSAKIPLAYLHPAKRLVEAGLDVTKLPVEPETSAELAGDTWYYYPAGGRTEPFHGKASERRWSYGLSARSREVGPTSAPAPVLDDQDLLVVFFDGESGEVADAEVARHSLRRVASRPPSSRASIASLL